MGTKGQMAIFESFVEKIDNDLFADFERYKQTDELPKDKKSLSDLEYLMRIILLLWIAGNEYPTIRELGFKPTPAALAGFKEVFYKVGKPLVTKELEIFLLTLETFGLYD